MQIKYKNQELNLKFNHYTSNGALALLAFDTEGAMWGVLTVNLTDTQLTDKNCSFLDTNNIGEDIVHTLIKYNIGELTGQFGNSGFCIYPEFRFNTQLIEMEA